MDSDGNGVRHIMDCVIVFLNCKNVTYILQIHQVDLDVNVR